MAASIDDVLGGEKIRWDVYHTSSLITTDELSLINAYDKKSVAEKRSILEQNGATYARLFMTLLGKINKDDAVVYVLALIDEALKESEGTGQHLLQLAGPDAAAPGPLPWEPFVRILNRATSDVVINQKSSLILAKLMTHKKAVVPASVLQTTFSWQLAQLDRAVVEKTVSVQEVQTALASLKVVLSNDDFRRRLIDLECPKKLAAVLSKYIKLEKDSSKLKLVYEASFCGWLLTFNVYFTENASGAVGGGLLPAIIDTVRLCSITEKIARVSLAALTNLLDKGTNNTTMLECDLLKLVSSLRSKKSADEEMEADLTKLEETLQLNVVELSNWDIYRKEVTSGVLTWSPVHRSERFWRENIQHFEEGNFHLIGLLRDALNSPEELTRSIACFDLGEFVRHHPRGRQVFQRLGVKEELMKLMSNKSAVVQKNAILAVQKMLTNNWEYLVAKP